MDTWGAGILYGRSSGQVEVLDGEGHRWESRNPAVECGCNLILSLRYFVCLESVPLCWTGLIGERWKSDQGEN